MRCNGLKSQYWPCQFHVRYFYALTRIAMFFFSSPRTIHDLTALCAPRKSGNIMKKHKAWAPSCIMRSCVKSYSCIRSVLSQIQMYGGIPAHAAGIESNARWLTLLMKKWWIHRSAIRQRHIYHLFAQLFRRSRITEQPYPFDTDCIVGFVWELFVST